MSERYAPGPDFEPDDGLRKYGEKHLGVDRFNDELSKFRPFDRYKRPRHDWNPAFRLWIQRAIDRHQAMATGGSEEETRERRARSYATPANASNPFGNPHGVSLPSHIAERRAGELIEVYERRIGTAVTMARYG